MPVVKAKQDGLQAAHRDDQLPVSSKDTRILPANDIEFENSARSNLGIMSARRKASIRPTVEDISDHSDDPRNGDSGNQRKSLAEQMFDKMSKHPKEGSVTDFDIRVDAIEKERKFTTDDEGNTTAEETTIKRIKIGKTELGEQYRIENKTVIKSLVDGKPRSRAMSGNSRTVREPPLSDTMSSVPNTLLYQTSAPAASYQTQGQTRSTSGATQYYKPVDGSKIGVGTRTQPSALCVPVGEDDSEDTRETFYRDPRPQIYRHGRADSPPYLSEMYQLPNLPQPAMYSSVPVPAPGQSRRSARKGKQLSDIYTQVSDNEFEKYNYKPNVRRSNQESSIGTEVWQDKKKRRAVVTSPKKVLRDAAHSCAIEVDDQGSLLTVTLTNDLVGTDLRFGRQEIQFQPDQHTHALGEPLKVIKKRHPRSYKVGMRYNAPTHVELGSSFETTVHPPGKLVKVKRRRLKTKRHERDNLFAPQGHNVISMHQVHGYNDDVLGYFENVAPEKIRGPEYMTAKSVLMVPEEITEEIPIGIKAFARDRIARWTYDSSSEESDEELPPYQTAKQLAEAGVLTEIDWRYNMEEEDAKRRATIMRANQMELERLKSEDKRVSYLGGQPVYMKRLNQASHQSSKSTVIPDMYPYAMPTDTDRAAERRRESQPYRAENQYYVTQHN